MNSAIASVVIPAHDEAARIEATIECLLASADEGEFEVVVVCNGCTDDTMDRAARVGGVRVEQIRPASKLAALRRGDQVATVYPRIYLDADVGLTTDGARALAAALQGSRAKVAGIQGMLVTDHSPRTVRWYFDFRQRLPVFGQGVIGAGVYALSARGHARVGVWPDVLGDDQYVLRLFGPSERAFVDGHQTRVEAPADLRTLIRRQLRVRRGNRQLTVGGPEHAPLAAPAAGVRVGLRDVAVQPRAWPGLCTWVMVNVVVRLLERLPRSHDWASPELSLQMTEGGRGAGGGP